MRYVATFGTASFPRRTLLGSPVNKRAYLRPGTVGTHGGEEARRVLSVFSVYAHSFHTAFERGDVHDGYRGAGVVMGWPKEGPGRLRVSPYG